jgi:hypothetical protein
MHPPGFETGSKTGKGYAGNLLVIQAGIFVIVDDQSNALMFYVQYRIFAIHSYLCFNILISITMILFLISISHLNNTDL